ncbi:hypothetical protein E3J59_04360 [Candidatus Aerophobetes bacterium]|uniref:DUF620 domain-containing protein n=1 Tax=Aerophobetes bacterium TaxID=2030807 RepID=A0A523URK0_UNCAE|nr:MAG: hypothetical protein E3J59_04360 [Candidatus Aerophobetes bacterium]
MLKVAKRAMIGTIIVGLVALSGSSCFGAMTVEKVLNNMERAHEKQMKGIEDLTMVQKGVGGMMAAFLGETITYQKKAKVEGRIIYKTRTEAKVMGMSVVTIYDGKYNWSVDPISGKVEKEETERDPAQIWRNIDPSETHYLGEEEIEGEKTHVLKIDDPFKVMGEQPTLPPKGEEDVQEVEAWGKLWISDKTWMIVRWLTTIKSKSIQEGKEVITTMRITTDLKDYQKHSTMLIPHKLVINTSMEMDMPGSSEEERKEMEMMQQFMGGMGSLEIEITEVQVNTGLSDDLFDPTKL